MWKGLFQSVNIVYGKFVFPRKANWHACNKQLFRPRLDWDSLDDKGITCLTSLFTKWLICLVASLYVVPVNAPHTWKLYTICTINFESRLIT